MRIVLIFSIIWSCLLVAMDEVPIPFVNHIKSSDVIILGTYQGKNYKKLPNSVIATEYRFKLISHFGIKRANSEKNLEFKVYQRGGVWNGKEYSTKYPPEFAINDNVLLFLKKKKFGFWFVSDLQSQYQLERKGRENYITSLTYPLHPTMGQGSFKNFNSLVRKHKGQSLVQLDEKIIATSYHQKRKFKEIYRTDMPGARRGRSIASASVGSTKPNPIRDAKKIDTFWLLLSLVLLSGFYRVFVKST
jgi:hypothetical protein